MLDLFCLVWVLCVRVPSFPTPRSPLPPPTHKATHHHHTQKGEKLDGASLDYLSQLFDSYSATFDASLHALEYKAPELLRRCARVHVYICVCIYM